MLLTTLGDERGYLKHLIDVWWMFEKWNDNDKKSSFLERSIRELRLCVNIKWGLPCCGWYFIDQFHRKESPEASWYRRAALYPSTYWKRLFFHRFLLLILYFWVCHCVKSVSKTLSAETCESVYQNHTNYKYMNANIQKNIRVLRW